jgi:ABC-type transport system involved in multi-copper enzyme maturation permease subunit
MLVAAGTGWGLQRLLQAAPTPAAGLALVAVMTIFLAFLFSVVLALGAAFLAAPALAGDIESGIALAVLPRPVSRAEYVLGKWLGVAVLLASFGAAAGGIELAAIAVSTGYHPPHPAAALLYLIAQSVVMLTLALLFSTRLPAVAGGLLAVVCFGVAWIAGIAAGIAHALHNETVLHAATFAGLLVPTDGLWRGAVNSLEPVALLVLSNAANTAGQNPFAAAAPPPPAFLAWTAAWVAAVLAIAVFSFDRRDI